MDEQEKETLITFGDAIKVLGDGKVGGYLVRYTSEDEPDLEGEYFDKTTDFVTPLPGQSLGWFSHGLYEQKKQLSNPVEMKEEEFGIWAETILDERDQYEKFLLDQAEAGKMAWSSGTASHLVVKEQKENAVHIKSWPLGLDASLTHIPAEPKNTVIPLKQLSDKLPPLDPIAEDEPEAEQTPAGSEADETKATYQKALEKPINLEVSEMDEEKNTIEMTPEELKELVADAVKTGAEEAIKSLPAPPEPKPVVEVEVDEADKPFGDVGKFFKAVADEAQGNRRDVRLKSLKSEDGYAVRQYKAQPTGLGEEIPAEGGYLVGTDEPGGLLDRMWDDAAVLNSLSPTEISSNSNSITLNALDETSRADGSRWGGVRGYWTAEAATITASQPTFRELHLRLKKVAALCYATDELLADSAALASWINRTVPQELRFKVEDAVINGDGSGKPQGILNNSAIYASVTAETGQASATIVSENVDNMWAQMWPGSLARAEWFINQEVYPQLFGLERAVGTGGGPAYLPPGGLSAAPYGTLMGKAINPIEYAAALGTLGDIIFADMSQYAFARKGGVQAASSIHVEFLTDQTVFRFTYRCDGQPIWNSSLTPFKGSAVQSPFVVLATRS